AGEVAWMARVLVVVLAPDLAGGDLPLHLRQQRLRPSALPGGRGVRIAILEAARRGIDLRYLAARILARSATVAKAQLTILRVDDPQQAAVGRVVKADEFPGGREDLDQAAVGVET